FAADALRSRTPRRQPQMRFFRGISWDWIVPTEASGAEGPHWKTAPGKDERRWFWANADLNGPRDQIPDGWNFLSLSLSLSLSFGFGFARGLAFLGRLSTGGDAEGLSASSDEGSGAAVASALGVGA